ncbi:methyltransferase domain-containing protein [Patescibacteria group bacterium]
MKEPIIKILRKIRGKFTRFLYPRNEYFLFDTTQSRKNSLKPISIKYGFDRGKPIDRYYIENFLEKNSACIKGACLEVTDNEYTKRFGGNRVTISDVLDFDKGNKNANIYSDLRNPTNINDETYDCLIMTQVFVMIDDYESAVKECWRILKPGGTLLVTMPCLSPVWNKAGHHWRWTEASGNYIFNKCFPHSELVIETYGNALVGQAYWVGMSCEDLTKEELEYNDSYFPVTVTIKVVKKSLR